MKTQISLGALNATVLSSLFLAIAILCLGGLASYGAYMWRESGNPLIFGLSAGFLVSALLSTKVKTNADR